MSDRVRKISAACLSARGAERASTIRRVQKKKTIVAFAFCLVFLIGGAGLAMPHHPQAGAAVWLQRRGEARHYQGHGFYDHQFSGRRHMHGEHLPQWYRQHQNLPPLAQERALRAEPGFNRLPPWEQQRLFNRLRQLNAMPPGERERTLERMEALERLSPEQRQQVRSTMQQITHMPEERRRRMRGAFQALSQVNPMQRRALLNSPEYKRRFSYQELQMLTILMSVQPYNPSPPYGPGMVYGGPPR